MCAVLPVPFFAQASVSRVNPLAHTVAREGGWLESMPERPGT